MARDPKVTRKAYEYKLGKDLVSKLDDKQIHLLSQYYNSLSDKETSEIDSQIVQGRNNTELHEMAIGMVEENESKKTPPKPKAKPKPKVAPKPKPKAKPKKVYDEDRSVAYKLPDYILKDLDEDQIKDLSSYYNSLPPDQKRKVDSEMVKGSGDLMDLARQMSDPLQEKWNTGGLDTWTGKPKENSNAKQGPMPMPSAKKKPDKKAVTAIVKKFSTEKKEDTKQQSTNETIDPTILRLLGLEDAFDLDYDTYKTLLREKMAAGRMSKSQIPTEETELLTNEFKRVKSKTGRFKPKKKSVNISKVVQSGKKYNKSAVNTQKLLSGSKEAESTKVKVKGEAVTDSFENINQSLLGIDSLLKNILGEEKKESEQEEKTARKAAQKAEEEKSEKNAKTKATKALKGFKAPKMGFLDMIKRFFKNILLGGFIMKALDWFQKEENQEKIQNVITFITDHMDKILLGIAALVGLNIGMKILDFLKLFSPLIKGVLFVLKGFLGIIPKIINKFKPKPKPTPKNTPNKGNQNKPRQGTGKNAGRTSGRGTGKPGQNITQGGGRNTGGGRVTGSGGRTIQRGRTVTAPKGGSGFKGGKTGAAKGLLGLLAILGMEHFFGDKIEDFGTAMGGMFGVGPRSKSDEEIVKQLEEAEKKAAYALENPYEVDPIDTIELITGDLGTPVDVLLREAQRRGLVEIAEDGQSYTYLNKSTETDSTTTPVPSTTPPVIPKTSLLGKQSSAPTADYGAGSDGGPKGFVIVPGHAAGLGAPGEMEITPQLADNLVANLRKRVGPDVPVTVMNMHAETELTQEAFTKQQDRLKALEDQGYEVIELHMDASVESGASPGGGRGVILPMPGTDAINPVEADFAKNYGAFPREHRGGLGGTNRGVSLIELGNMSPGLQEAALSGNVPKSDLDILTKPLEDSLIRGLRLPEVKPTPKIEPPAPPNTDPAPVVLPLSGGGSGDNELSSASGGRASAASFSSIDGNNPNPRQVGSLFNFTAVG